MENELKAVAIRGRTFASRNELKEFIDTVPENACMFFCAVVPTSENSYSIDSFTLCPSLNPMERLGFLNMVGSRAYDLMNRDESGDADS